MLQGVRIISALFLSDTDPNLDTETSNWKGL